MVAPVNPPTDAGQVEEEEDMAEAPTEAAVTGHIPDHAPDPVLGPDPVEGDHDPAATPHVVVVDGSPGHPAGEGPGVAAAADLRSSMSSVTSI